MLSIASYVEVPTMNPYLIVVYGLFYMPTSLQSGLDDKTAAAMNGFNYLQTVAQKYGNRYIQNSLEKGK